MPPAVLAATRAEPAPRRARVNLSAAMPYLVAAALVLPMFAPEVWSGFRVASADDVLASIAITEQPLSARSPAGHWAIGLALVWFALAYWRRRVRWWEATLVILGSTAALIRMGNAWLDGLALIAPLGLQLSAIRSRPGLLLTAAVAGVLVAAATLWATRPPPLPTGAIQAAESASGTGNVFADWRWAAQLQRQLSRRVLASGGLASEPRAFWLDYVRVVQDYERWPAELRNLNVDLVVLETSQSAMADQVRASSEWHVVYDADNALVAERLTP